MTWREALTGRPSFKILRHLKCRLWKCNSSLATNLSALTHSGHSSMKQPILMEGLGQRKWRLIWVNEVKNPNLKQIMQLISGWKFSTNYQPWLTSLSDTEGDRRRQKPNSPFCSKKLVENHLLKGNSGQAWNTIDDIHIPWHNNIQESEDISSMQPSSNILSPIPSLATIDFRT